MASFLVRQIASYSGYGAQTICLADTPLLAAWSEARTLAHWTNTLPLDSPCRASTSRPRFRGTARLYERAHNDAG